MQPSQKKIMDAKLPKIIFRTENTLSQTKCDYSALLGLKKWIQQIETEVFMIQGVDLKLMRSFFKNRINLRKASRI